MQFVRITLAIFSLVLLSACGANSDGSGQTSDSSSSLVTTTLGTRSLTSQANPAITANAGATWSEYSRAEDYPAVAKLPLQFITLTTGANAGKKLGVLVSVPADAARNPVAGTFPVILTQTAYRIDMGALFSKVIHFGNTLVIGGADDGMIKRGYISVAVDVLGSGVSDGEVELLGNTEQQAYADTVNWITQQSWFNGSIGVAGTSYLGIDALLTAEQGNPAVKAAFVEVPMADPWRDVIGTGGLLNNLFVSIWLPLTQNMSVLNGPEINKYPEYAAQIEAATQQHIDATNDFYIPLYDQTRQGVVGYSTDDGDFWSQRAPIERAPQIQVPTFVVGGAHDIFQRGEPLLYEQLKRNVTTKLVIMPGDHLQILLESLLGATQGEPDGVPGTPTLMLQWFDQYLKGINTGADKVPNVTQFIDGYGENGARRYAITTDWPHPLAAPRRIYLHGDMTLSEQAPSAGEATHTVAEPSAIPTEIATTSENGKLLVMDGTPADGSECSISYQQWTLGLATPQACFSDDNRVERVQHALIYETPALDQDMYINGPIEADIWMSTTVTMAAVAVRIDDVDANGIAKPLSTGQLSATYRGVDESRSRYINGVMIQPWHHFTVVSALPVVPGEPMQLPIEVFPTAALIRSGHHLRVALSASNQAQGVWATSDQLAAAGGISTIYNDPDHPSSVVLPIVPSSELHGL